MTKRQGPRRCRFCGMNQATSSAGTALQKEKEKEKERERGEKAENAEAQRDVGWWEGCTGKVDQLANEAARKQDKECTRVLASMVRGLCTRKLCNSAEYKARRK